MFCVDYFEPRRRAGLFRRRGSTIVAFVVSFVILITAASGVSAQAERETVRVDGRAVFRVGAAGEQTAAARARAIERRLGTLLENPEAIAPARVENSATNPADRIIDSP